MLAPPGREFWHNRQVNYPDGLQISKIIAPVFPARAQSFAASEIIRIPGPSRDSRRLGEDPMMRPPTRAEHRMLCRRRRGISCLNTVIVGPGEVVRPPQHLGDGLPARGATRRVCEEDCASDAATKPGPVRWRAGGSGVMVGAKPRSPGNISAPPPRLRTFHDRDATIFSTSRRLVFERRWSPR
jgi:hypothetical protein